MIFLPQMLGARDLPFPRLSAFGFWMKNNEVIFDPAWLADHMRRTLEKTGGYISWDRFLTPERMLRVASSEGRFSQEEWCVRRDGTRFRASIALSPVRDTEGRLREYVFFVQDLTGISAIEDARRLPDSSP